MIKHTDGIFFSALLGHRRPETAAAESMSEREPLATMMRLLLLVYAKMLLKFLSELAPLSSFKQPH